MKSIFFKFKIAYAFIFFYLPSVAFAQLSARSQGISEETGTIFTEIVFWVKILGAITFMVAIVSAIKKKKQQQELDWEVWGMIGGAVLTVAMLFLGDTASTLSGQDVQIAPAASSSDF